MLEKSQLGGPYDPGRSGHWFGFREGPALVVVVVFMLPEVVVAHKALSEAAEEALADDLLMLKL